MASSCEEILARVVSDIEEKERKIQLTCALDYVMGLVDERFFPILDSAIAQAKTAEDYYEILRKVKKVLGQRTVTQIWSEG